MFLFILVHIYIGVHTYTYICLNTYIHTHIWRDIYAYIHTYIYTYIYHTYIRRSLLSLANLASSSSHECLSFIYIHIYVYIYIYIYIYIWTYLQIYIYIHKNINTYKYHMSSTNFMRASPFQVNVCNAHVYICIFYIYIPVNFESTYKYL